MEGKNDIVAPIFKTKNSVVKNDEFIPRPAAKLQDYNIELTIFKGSNLSLAAYIAKVVIPLIGTHRSMFTLFAIRQTSVKELMF